jgi:predicted amidohydrolase YtcJ
MTHPFRASLAAPDRTVLPGLCDAHLHVYWLGEQITRQCDVSDVRDFPQLFDRLQAFAAERPTGYLIARGLDDQALREHRLPYADELDAHFPHRPVILIRRCGHIGILNAAVRHLLPAATPDARGRIEEHAFWEVLRSLPKPTDAELDAAALAALRLARSRGLTAVGTILEQPRQLASLVRLRLAGLLPVRVTAHPPGDCLLDLHKVGMLTGFGDPWLRIGAVKYFADGTFGARTAWLEDDYTDAPGQRGQDLFSASNLAQHFQTAHSLGFQIAVHAIGDAAVRAVAHALAPLCDGHNPRRHRIEHVSLCPDDVLEVLARNRIVAVVQPQFVPSDSWLEQRLGPRVKHAYRFRALLDAGVPLALSSDCPVEPIDPLATLAAATTGNPWNRDGALTHDQAVHAYTHGANFAAHADTEREALPDATVLDHATRTLTAYVDSSAP